MSSGCVGHRQHAPTPHSTSPPSLLLFTRRIKYILRQSDIFATHFGVAVSESESESESEDESSSSGADGATSNGAAAAGGSPSKRRGRPSGREGEDSTEADANSGEEAAPTYLVQQPPSISGGTLRSYQLEGLNWMINLQAQGTNGACVLRACVRILRVDVWHWLHGGVLF